MSLRAVLVVLLILLATHGAFSYPSGPPASVCNDLRPGSPHGDPQAGNGGFLISTDLPVSQGNAGGYDYTAGRLYTVLINDTNTPSALPGFRGFLVQAQSVPGSNLIGTFMPDAEQLQQYLDCPDSMGNRARRSTVTHHNGGRQNFMEQRILWRAPPEMNGRVEFRYSVVQRLPTYYSNLQASLEENRGAVLPQTMELTTPPPTEPPSGPVVFQVSQPPGCIYGTGNCKRSVRFLINETHFTFDLEGDEAGWVAVGFSITQDMFSTDVFACARSADGTMVQVLDTWNVAGARANEVDDTQDDIQAISAEFINDRITCSFTRTINGENPGRDIYLKDELFVMVGTSINQLTSSGQLLTHVGGGVAIPLITVTPINISNDGSPSEETQVTLTGDTSPTPSTGVTSPTPTTSATPLLTDATSPTSNATSPSILATNRSMLVQAHGIVIIFVLNIMTIVQ